MPDEKFKVIAEWFYLVILEMTYLKGFSNDPEKISQLLQDSISPSVVKEALQFLLGLGLLEKTKKGTYLKSTKKHLETASSSSAIHHHQLQMMEKAREALKTPRPGRQKFITQTLTIRKADLPRLLKLVSGLQNDLMKIAVKEQGLGDATYQVNLQLFSLAEERSVSV